MTKPSGAGWPVMIVSGTVSFVVPWLHALEQWVGLNFWGTSGIWAGLSMLLVVLGVLFVPVLFVTGAVLLFFRAHRFHGIWLIFCSFFTVLSVAGVSIAADIFNFTPGCYKDVNIKTGLCFDIRSGFAG